MANQNVIKKLESFSEKPISEKEAKYFKKDLTLNYDEYWFIMKNVKDGEDELVPALQKIVGRGGDLGEAAKAAIFYASKGKSGLIDEIIKASGNSVAYKTSLLNFYFLNHGLPEVDDIKKLLEGYDPRIFDFVVTRLLYGGYVKEISKREYRVLVPALTWAISNRYPESFAVDYRVSSIDLLGKIATREDVEAIKVLENVQKHGLYFKNIWHRIWAGIDGKLDAKQALEKIMGRK